MSQRLECCLLLTLFLLGCVGLGAEPRKRVLVLQSYNEHLTWTQSIAQGLHQGLADARWDLWFESLDAKNLGPSVDMTILDPWLTEKYRGVRFDLVITEDDAAYAYFVRTRKAIFQEAPGLAIGLNGRPTTRLPGVSYFLENPDYGKTLNLTLDLFPQARTIHLVIDQTDTSREIRRQLQNLSLTRPVTFDWIDGSAEQILARCAALSPGDILVFGLYFDPKLGYNSYDWLLQEVRRVSRVPIFGFWTFAMDSGATGGYLYDGKTLGLEAARVARSLVETGASPVFTDQPLCCWTFDWPQVERFRLPHDKLPAGIYLHSPQTFWSIHWGAVVTTGVILILLVGFILLILVNLRIKHRMIEAGDDIIATQRELMASLGDVIETRSEETASHVQRITRLSVLLGDLLGISMEQRQQLEICASMHDIGKIGIPDEILKNPGKLTAQEMEVMRTHTVIGHSIFCTSPNPLFQAAATIALEHHERWDGTGYPYRKAGKDIHVLSRIVSLVDVFDALLTKRVYKEAWEPERVRLHIENESGQAFDPAMTKVFLEHWDEFCQVREGTQPPPTLRWGPRNKRRAKSPWSIESLMVINHSEGLTSR